MEVRHRGTLTLLEDWLRARIEVEDSDVFDVIMEPLKEVRRLRQRPAHRIETDQFNRRYHDMQDQLMKTVYTSVSTIRRWFGTHPDVKDYKVPDWLDKGKIKSY